MFFDSMYNCSNNFFNILEEVEEYMEDFNDDYENNGPGVNRYDYEYEDDYMDSLRNNQKRLLRNRNSGGCYIATCVYGSYDCQEVWTLRRFRDQTLAKTVIGRIFIKIYYWTSPTLVFMFGDYKWFRVFWKNRLDKMVKKLNEKGVLNTEYRD